MQKNQRNNTDNSLDAIVERLNRRIAWLLGSKKNNYSERFGHASNLPPRETSKFMFWVMIITLSLFLWGVTGFYYLADSQYGIIFLTGRITKIIKGPRLGMTMPYPFGDIEVIDGRATNLLNLASDGDADNNYISLTRDVVMVGLNAQFAYMVVDPHAYYLNNLNEDNADEAVRLKLQAVLHNYLASVDYVKLSHANLTMTASLIRQQANYALSNLGISLTKLNVNKIYAIISNEPSVKDNTNASAIISSGRDFTRSVVRERDLNNNGMQ